MVQGYKLRMSKSRAVDLLTQDSKVNLPGRNAVSMSLQVNRSNIYSSF
jgi:hypothetical protein